MSSNNRIGILKSLTIFVQLHKTIFRLLMASASAFIVIALGKKQSNRKVPKGLPFGTNNEGRARRRALSRTTSALSNRNQHALGGGSAWSPSFLGVRGTELRTPSLLGTLLEEGGFS